MRRVPSGLAPLLAVAVGALLGLGVREARAERVLEVSVDAEARLVEGTLTETIDNPTDAPLGTVYFWSFPARLAVRQPVPEQAFYWYYPRSFNPAAMSVGAVRSQGRTVTVKQLDHAAAGKGTLIAVTLEPPLPPGESVSIELGFVTRVPTRYGPFGCYRGTCTLGGGFYPMLAALDQRGFVLDAPPAASAARITVRVPRVSDVLVQGELCAVEAGGQVTRTLAPAIATTLVVGRPRLFVRTRQVGGVLISLYSPDRNAVEVDRTTKTVDLASGPIYKRGSRVDEMLDVAQGVVEMLGELGLPPPARVNLLDGALRAELAESLPGLTLISDEAFRIFPLGRFLKFHEFEIARAIFGTLLQDRIVGRSLEGEAITDLAFTPELLASYLTDLYTLRAYRKQEFAKQILGWASFIPAVDRVLYAPQVPFAQAYFDGTADPERQRDRLLEWNSIRPRGKFLYVKLRELVGEGGLGEIVKQVYQGQPLRIAAEAVAQHSLESFFSQWLSGRIDVDYYLGKIVSKHLPSGRWRHTIEVLKRGKARPVEPVTVQVREWSGHKTRGVWDGKGDRGVVVIETTGRRLTVEIDPDGRLTELLDGVIDDLRLNNRDYKRWRFIWNNFGGLLNFQTMTLDLSIDASAWRIHDLRQSFRFAIYRTQATQVGLQLGYSRYFGPRTTAASLAGRFGITTTVGRISPSFGRVLGGEATPGTTVSTSLGLSYDNRKYEWEPQRSFSVGASLGGVLTILDTGRVLGQGTLSLGWDQLVPLADGHGLAMALSGAITFGDLRIPRQMLGLGGAGGLRGYEIDELLGRARVFTRLEYRHVFVRDLSLNLFRLLYVRGIAGGLFAEAGLVSACDSYAVSPRAIGASVGYTLRVQADWFGVSQTVLQLDLGVPVVRHDQSCFGPLRPASSRAPIGFFVSFSPPW